MAGNGSCSVRGATFARLMHVLISTVRTFLPRVSVLEIASPAAPNDHLCKWLNHPSQHFVLGHWNYLSPRSPLHTKNSCSRLTTLFHSFVQQLTTTLSLFSVFLNNKTSIIAVLFYPQTEHNCRWGRRETEPLSTTSQTEQYSTLCNHSSN